MLTPYQSRVLDNLNDATARMRFGRKFDTIGNIAGGGSMVGNTFYVDTVSGNDGNDGLSFG